MFERFNDDARAVIEVAAMRADGRGRGETVQPQDLFVALRIYFAKKKTAISAFLATLPLNDSISTLQSVQPSKHMQAAQAVGLGNAAKRVIAYAASEAELGVAQGAHQTRLLVPRLIAPEHLLLGIAIEQASDTSTDPAVPPLDSQFIRRAVALDQSHHQGIGASHG